MKGAAYARCAFGALMCAREQNSCGSRHTSLEPQRARPRGIKIVEREPVGLHEMKSNRYCSIEETT
jgi:hypothetical protein